MNRNTSKQTSPSPLLLPWLQSVGIEASFRTLADLLPHAAVFVVDANRDLVFWSDGATRLLGFKAPDVLKRHCLTGIRCAQCLEGCGIAQYGQVQDVPLLLHHEDGRQIPVRKYAQAFFDSARRFVGGIEVLLPSDAPTPRPMLEPSAQTTFHGMVTRDPAMLKAIQIIKNVAETEATVLVRGESGTGKELVARAIHQESHRKDGPFVAVNCGALAPTLLESELFGHVKGAFTGAVSDRVGIFVQANRGTLFLDEVAELPLELQPKLLRVLQEREVIPLGAQKPIPVDVRIVSATHRALREEVQAGRFREDLMYRLRVVPIFLPPLRERPSDLEPLLQYFLDKHNARGPRRVTSISPEAKRALLDHRWPGNVRELQNVMEYAFAVGRGPSILLDELPPEFREGPRAPASTGPLPSRQTPSLTVEQALALTHGDLQAAASLLGVSRTTLWRMRRKQSS